MPSGLAALLSRSRDEEADEALGVSAGSGESSPYRSEELMLVEHARRELGVRLREIVQALVHAAARDTWVSVHAAEREAFTILASHGTFHEAQRSSDPRAEARAAHARRWYLGEVAFALVLLAEPDLRVAELDAAAAAADAEEPVAAESSQVTAATDADKEEAERRASLLAVYLSRKERVTVVRALSRLVVQASPAVALRSLFPMLSAVDVTGPTESLNFADGAVAAPRRRALVAALIGTVMSGTETGLRGAVSALLIESAAASEDPQAAARFAAAAAAAPPDHVMLDEAPESSGSAPDGADKAVASLALTPASTADKTAYLQSICRQLVSLLTWYHDGSDAESSGALGSEGAGDDDTARPVDPVRPPRNRFFHPYVTETGADVGRGGTALPEAVRLFFGYLADALIRPDVVYGPSGVLRMQPLTSQGMLARLQLVNKEFLGPAFAPLTLRRPTRNNFELGRAAVRFANLCSGAVISRLPEGFFLVLEAVMGGLLQLCGCSPKPFAAEDADATEAARPVVVGIQEVSSSPAQELAVNDDEAVTPATPTGREAVSLCRSSVKALLTFAMDSTAVRARVLVAAALVKAVCSAPAAGVVVDASDDGYAVAVGSPGAEDQREAAAAWLLDVIVSQAELITGEGGEESGRRMPCAALLSAVVEGLVAVVKAGTSSDTGRFSDSAGDSWSSATRAFAWLVALLHRVDWSLLFESSPTLLRFLAWFASRGGAASELSARVLGGLEAAQLSPADEAEAEQCIHALRQLAAAFAAMPVDGEANSEAAATASRLCDSMRRAVVSARVKEAMKEKSDAEGSNDGGAPFDEPAAIATRIAGEFGSIIAALEDASRRRAATAQSVALAELDASVERHTTPAVKKPSAATGGCLALHIIAHAAPESRFAPCKAALHRTFQRAVALLQQLVMAPSSDAHTIATTSRLLATIALHRFDGERCEHVRQAAGKILAAGLDSKAPPPLGVTVAKCRVLDVISYVCDRDAEGRTTALLLGREGGVRGSGPVDTIYALCRADAQVPPRVRLCAMSALGLALFRSPRLLPVGSVVDLAQGAMRHDPNAPKLPAMYRAGRSVAGQDDRTLGAMTRVACASMVSQIVASGAVDPAVTPHDEIKRLHDLCNAMRQFRESTSTGPSATVPTAKSDASPDNGAMNPQGADTDDATGGVPIDTEALIRAHGDAAMKMLRGEDPLEDPTQIAWRSHPLNLWRAGGILAEAAHSTDDGTGSGALRVVKPADGRREGSTAADAVGTEVLNGGSSAVPSVLRVVQ